MLLFPFLLLLQARKSCSLRVIKSIELNAFDGVVSWIIKPEPGKTLNFPRSQTHGKETKRLTQVLALSPKQASQGIAGARRCASEGSCHDDRPEAFFVTGSLASLLTLVKTNHVLRSCRQQPVLLLAIDETFGGNFLFFFFWLQFQVRSH